MLIAMSAHTAWIERVHPDDRATYCEALGDLHRGARRRCLPSSNFGPAARAGDIPWSPNCAPPWLADGAEADRCLGLVADVTARKEDDAAASERTTRDSLTGLSAIAWPSCRPSNFWSAKLSQVTFAMLDIGNPVQIRARQSRRSGGPTRCLWDASRSALLRRFGKTGRSLSRQRGRIRPDLRDLPRPAPLHVGTDLVECLACCSLCRVSRKTSSKSCWGWTDSLVGSDDRANFRAPGRGCGFICRIFSPMSAASRCGGRRAATTRPARGKALPSP